GVTVLPVCPTCSSFGRQPASVTARDAPVAAPSASASSSTSFQFSGPLRPRPADTTARASASDTRLPPLAVASKRPYRRRSSEAAAAISFTPGAGALAGRVHAPARTETTAGSGTFTTARIFPAYIGRLTSTAPSAGVTSVQSAAYAHPSFAAARAPRSRPPSVAPTSTRSAPLAFSATAALHAI